MIHEITVGLDGSMPSMHAMTWASEVCAASGAQLRMVHALEPRSAEIDPERSARLRASARDRMAGAWAAPARDRG